MRHLALSILVHSQPNREGVREPALRFRETHAKEIEVAAHRVQGNDSSQPDGLRGQVFERVHVRLPVGHV